MNARMNRGLGWGLLPWSLTVIAVTFITAHRSYGSTEISASALLPSGFLSVQGAQIVGPDGAPVRIASVGLTGMNIIGGRLQLVEPFHAVDGHVAAMKAMSFNCVRVDWINTA